MKERPAVCVFGCYQDSDLYQRNRVLARTLLELGSDSFQVRPALQSDNTGNQARLSSPAGLLRVCREQLRQLFSLLGQRRALASADLFFIPYPAYLDRWYLRLMTLGSRRRPLVVDAFLCLHDTVVADRQLLKPGSPGARLVAWLERGTLEAADCVLIDTEQQKTQLCERYDLPADKVRVVPVGLDEDQWTPLPPPPAGAHFEVLFWGTFIPLHGVPTIIEAARLLQQRDPTVRVTLLGDGQTAADCAALLDSAALDNLQWRRRLCQTAELREAIAASHCVLGVFGATDKAASVVPYKAYQALASDRMLITRSGSAMDPLARECDGIALVPPADPEALATAILAMKDAQARTGAVSTRALYDRRLSQRVIREVLADVVEGLRD